MRIPHWIAIALASGLGSGCYPVIGDVQERAGQDASSASDAASDQAGTEARVKLVTTALQLPTDQSSIDVAVPAGVIAGDFLLATLYVGSGSSSDVALDQAPGWTVEAPLEPASCGGFRVWYAYRFVQSGDPSSYSVSFKASSGPVQGVGLALVVYRGVSSTTPFAAKQAKGTAGDDFSLPSLVTAVPDTMLVASFVDGFNKVGDWKFPAGMSEVMNTAIFAVGQAEQTAAGPCLSGAASSIQGGCGTIFYAALAHQ
ncbi:MAG: hypothetical protein KC776_34070 [Myxococcales bacterium]|nr:hypothetical protein [Myxococcales bacterium]